MTTSKRFSTLQARAALSLIELSQNETDSGQPLYIATKWAVTQQFTDLDELESWITLGGAPVQTTGGADAKQ